VSQGVVGMQVGTSSRRRVCESSLLVVEFLLSSREKMTLGVGAIFWLSMPYQPEGLGIQIYRLLASQEYVRC
jgi:hypothetical protein